MPAPEVENLELPNAPVPCAPRRKRRRTPAAGAANDCFSCSGQKLRCDRKRPYCTPCLDVGKDCAGYKTTLTWGVGVASRGKLRGLSLPIAGIKQKPMVRVKSSPCGREAMKSELPRRRLQKVGPGAGSAHTYPPATLFPPNESLDTSGLNVTWQPVPAAMYMALPPLAPSGRDAVALVGSPDSLLADSPHSSKPDQFMSKACPEPAEAQSGQYFGALSEAIVPQKAALQFRDFQWPLKSQPYRQDVVDPLQWQHAECWSAQVRCERSSSPSRSDEMDPSRAPYRLHTNDQRPSDPDKIAYAQSYSNSKPGSYVQVMEGQNFDHVNSNRKRVSVSPSTESLRQTALKLLPFSGAHAIGRTPRMQYLINYYTEVISPVIVAFDGPSNPYRSYILRLASGSETLQHAISALSASNLRQRRESGELSTGKTDPARRSSMAHLTLTDKSWQSAPGFNLSVEEQKQEENYHKNATVHLIQQQFADPSQHRDDSVLATLLVVCLFHICESGVAKFKTHFAGAKKLLGMRETASIMKSKEARWFARMFTWFDAMTATVNDREGQMQDGLLDLSSLADEDWTLENLAGCDGKLFKIMANLSRLNILSQKGGLDAAGAAGAAVTASCSCPMSTGDHSYWPNFDRDSWATGAAGGTYPMSNESYPSIHTQYGREWHDTHNALTSWMLDTSPYSSGGQDVPALSPDQQLDLLNISQCFRFSALIYMERLALPRVFSSDARIQNWVQKSLYYIRLVHSDVYLLWPLFVTGSECVTAADQQIIRERCLDIQKDSGFSNNASCLKLLEEIWISGSSPAGNVRQPNGFRWRAAIQANVSDGGEYIVV
jgi:Fungal specific transcription factor domain/Fungal Zn(2)-Cys(6) binuclear cluster domain